MIRIFRIGIPPSHLAIERLLLRPIRFIEMPILVVYSVLQKDRDIVQSQRANLPPDGGALVRLLSVQTQALTLTQQPRVPLHARGPLYQWEFAALGAQVQTRPFHGALASVP